MTEAKNTTKQIVQPLILSLAVAIGILIGLSINKYQEPGSEVQEGTKRFEEVLNYVNVQYVDTVDIPSLTEHAIKQMLHRLDPHTVYIPNRDVESAEASLKSNFKGIGIEYDIIRDTLVVLNPINGGPSKKAGLKSGDKIVRVEGENIAGQGLDDKKVAKLLKGEKDTKVLLGIKREGSQDILDYTITRDRIPVFSVDVGMMMEDGTGYIKILRFAEQTHSEFVTALKRLKKSGLKKLIIDVRDNPGGLLSQVVEICDELVPKGSLIVYTQGKTPSNNVKYLAERDGLFEDLPIVVLINENSASASEILAGALQDNDRALIVGRRSFGKGFVQNPINLDDGSQLRLTVSRYYTASGRCIQKPYSDDIAEYSKESYSRTASGELFVEDSIHRNENLKFKTLKLRRTVYGGGGIIPDQFVAKDTTGYSDLAGKLFYANAMREFAIEYYNEHSVELQKWKPAAFSSSFQVTDEMVEGVLKFAKRSGIKIKPTQLERSTELIKERVKVHLAGLLWERQGIYRVLNKSDIMIKRAYESMPQAKTLADSQVD